MISIALPVKHHLTIVDLLKYEINDLSTTERFHETADKIAVNISH